MVKETELIIVATEALVVRANSYAHYGNSGREVPCFFEVTIFNLLVS